MKISKLLNLYEQLLNEISLQGRRDATRVSDDDYEDIRRFLSQVLSFLDDKKAERLTTLKLANKMQQLRHKGTKVKILPSNDRTQQTLAHGHGDDPDTEVSMYERDVYEAVVAAIENDPSRASDPEYLSRVRDFLSKSGEKYVSVLVYNRQAFSRAVANHTSKSGSLVQDTKHPDDIKGKSLDFNSFVFLMSIEVKQSRGKQSWDQYVNPKKLSEVKRAFGTGELDQQEAYDTLKNLGFIERDSETGKYTINRTKIKDFKERIKSHLESIIGQNDYIKLSSSTGTGRERGTATARQELETLISEYIPSEIAKMAERWALDGLWNMANKKADPDILSVIKAYKNSKETSDEYGVDITKASVELVEPVVKRVQMKYIAAQLSNILTSKKIDIRLGREYTTLVRAIRQRSKKFK